MSVMTDTYDTSGFTDSSYLHGTSIGLSRLPQQFYNPRGSRMGDSFDPKRFQEVITGLGSRKVPGTTYSSTTPSSYTAPKSYTYTTTKTPLPSTSAQPPSGHTLYDSSQHRLPTPERVTRSKVPSVYSQSDRSESPHRHSQITSELPRSFSPSSQSPVRRSILKRTESTAPQTTDNGRFEYTDRTEQSQYQAQRNRSPSARQSVPSHTSQSSQKPSNPTSRTWADTGITALKYGAGAALIAGGAWYLGTNTDMGRSAVETGMEYGGSAIEGMKSGLNTGYGVATDTASAAWNTLGGLKDSVVSGAGPTASSAWSGICSYGASAKSMVTGAKDFVSAQSSAYPMASSAVTCVGGMFAKGIAQRKINAYLENRDKAKKLAETQDEQHT